MPRAEPMRRSDAIEEFILSGWMPEKPFIGPESNIVAFGSCFAANIGRYLNSLGFAISTQKEGKAYIQRISDGLVNVFAIAQQFEWAWENRVPDVHLWHGWKAEDYGYDEEVRLETKRLFDEADVFILTFGLSEIWYDEPTGEVFWRAVPEDKYDPSRHKFRVATHAETVERLQRIYDLIRKHRPGASIIFTLSPVGLAATFRPVSCISANAVSKAKLRSAIDEVHTAANDANFFYFPSYEVVMEGFETPFNTDRRHPQIHVIETNMKAFEHYFCQTGLTTTQLREFITGALEADEIWTRGEREVAVKLAQANRMAWVEANAGASSADKEIKKRNASRTRQEKQSIREQKAAAREARARLREEKHGQREERLRQKDLATKQKDDAKASREAERNKIRDQNDERRALGDAKVQERERERAERARQKAALVEQKKAKQAELEAGRADRRQSSASRFEEEEAN